MECIVDYCGWYTELEPFRVRAPVLVFKKSPAALKSNLTFSNLISFDHILEDKGRQR
jgi:hypothetical protein